MVKISCLYHQLKYFLIKQLHYYRNFIELDLSLGGAYSCYNKTIAVKLIGLFKGFDVQIHSKLCYCLMLRLHRTTFSPRPYHVLKIQERGEDRAKMKQFRISKFPLRPYYVPATSLLRPHQVLTTSFTFPLRPQYALTKFIPFPLRPCYVLTKTKRFIPRANYVYSTF